MLFYDFSARATKDIKLLSSILSLYPTLILTRISLSSIIACIGTSCSHHRMVVLESNL